MRKAIPLLLLAFASCVGQTGAVKTYVGFDRNEYPGDQNLHGLHATFRFAGYWLNTPPDSRDNSWSGKRRLLKDAGFGFLLLFNGRKYLELKTVPDAALVGKQDASKAVASASAEGFTKGSIIFLDIEEGGRLLPEQKNYIFAWIDRVTKMGFRAGVYCSGIEVVEKTGSTISTARDIRQSAERRKISYWVSNDSCPPSPGCSVPARSQTPADSGIPFALVWQYAQSPRRDQFAAACRQTYGPDGSCYLSGVAAQNKIHLDLNLSTSPNPSQTQQPR